MDAFRRLLPRGGRKGFTATDYALATLSDPRLLGEAIRHVLTQRSRKVESGLRAARRPELSAAADGARLPWSLDRVLDSLAGHVHVLVLDRQPGSVTIGVAEVDLLSALVHLASLVPSLSLSIAGKPVSFGSTLFKSRALEAKQIAARFTDQSFEPVTLAIESYRRVAPGRWVSVNDRNTIARAVYAEIFEAPGITEASDILGGRTLEQIAESRPIDVVYTWVNHADPHWQELYRAARAPESRKIRDHLPNARIVAFEANPYTFKRFRSKIDYGAHGVEYIHQALSDQDGNVSFSVRVVNGRMSADGRGSMLVRKRSEIGVKAVEVPSARIDSYFSHADFGTCAIWMDVEGASREVLSGAEGIMGKIHVWFVEVEERESWQGQWLAADVERFMSRHDIVAVARDFQSRHQHNTLFVRRATLQNPTVKALITQLPQRARL